MISREPITFLFMDYETFNSNPKAGRVSQFASLRTSYNLEIIASSALNIFCEQTIDNIPSPQAALITRITPQKIERIKNGIEKIPESSFPVKPEVLNEYWFTSRINKEMMVPSTCTIGYNNFKFDDEFTRNLLFRNLFDPYAREWRNNNSRFDVYYLVIATYVLKPHLLNFPNAIDKETRTPLVHSRTKLPLPSFRLEELSVANDIHHLNAHDAFSDVEATIEIMKKIKRGDESFFEEMFAFRKKHNVTSWFYNNRSLPFIHISQYYGKENYSFGILTHLVSMQDETLCINLEHDLEPLLTLEGLELENYLFPPDSKSSSISVVKIRHNQCPLFASFSEYEDRLKNFNLDLAKIMTNLSLVIENKAILRRKLAFYYSKRYASGSEVVDSDLTIYDGFFTPLEEIQLESIRNCIASNKLENFDYSKFTPRIQEMFFKIKARNFSHTLNEAEINRWKTYSKERITNRKVGAELVVEDFYMEISALEQQNLSKDDRAVIQEIQDYVTSLEEKHTFLKNEVSNSIIEISQAPLKLEQRELKKQKVQSKKEVKVEVQKEKKESPKDILNITGTRISCFIIEFNEEEALYLEDILEKELIAYNKIFFERKAYKKLGYKNLEDLPIITEISGFVSSPYKDSDYTTGFFRDSNYPTGVFTYLKNNKKLFISELDKLEKKYHKGLFDELSDINSIIRGEDVKFRRKSKSKYFLLKKIETGTFSFPTNEKFQLNNLLFKHCVHHFKRLQDPLQLLEIENNGEKIEFKADKKTNVEMHISVF